MLKPSGYVRPVDELGRIVLPISVRRERGMQPKDCIEMFVDGQSIVLQKYVPGCVFCGEHVDLTEFKGKLVCRLCAEDISLGQGRQTS